MQPRVLNSARRVRVPIHLPNGLLQQRRVHNVPKPSHALPLPILSLRTLSGSEKEADLPDHFLVTRIDRPHSPVPIQADLAQYKAVVLGNVSGTVGLPHHGSFLDLICNYALAEDILADADSSDERKIHSPIDTGEGSGTNNLATIVQGRFRARFPNGIRIRSVEVWKTIHKMDRLIRSNLNMDVAATPFEALEDHLLRAQMLNLGGVFHEAQQAQARALAEEDLSVETDLVGATRMGPFHLANLVLRFPAAFKDARNPFALWAGASASQTVFPTDALARPVLPNYPPYLPGGVVYARPAPEVATVEDYWANCHMTHASRSIVLQRGGLVEFKRSHVLSNTEMSEMWNIAQDDAPDKESWGVKLDVRFLSPSHQRSQGSGKKAWRAVLVKVGYDHKETILPDGDHIAMVLLQWVLELHTAKLEVGLLSNFSHTIIGELQSACTLCISPPLPPKGIQLESSRRFSFLSALVAMSLWKHDNVDLSKFAEANELKPPRKQGTSQRKAKAAKPSTHVVKERPNAPDSRV